MAPTTLTNAATAHDHALEWLLRRGYRFVATDARVGPTRIPIVLTDGDVTVFVEVRSRDRVECDAALELVSRRRARLLVRAIGRYLAEHPSVPRMRIDVVTVTTAGDGRWALEHYLNAVP